MTKNPELVKAYTPYIYGPTELLMEYSRSSGGYSEILNTKGEIVWADEIALKHGLPKIDPTLDFIEKGLEQLGYAALGTVNTILENNWRVLGLPADDKTSIADLLGLPLDATTYNIGRDVGGGNILPPLTGRSGASRWTHINCIRDW